MRERKIEWRSRKRWIEDVMLDLKGQSAKDETSEASGNEQSGKTIELWGHMFVTDKILGISVGCLRNERKKHRMKIKEALD